MNHLLRPRIWPSFLASSGVPSTGSGQAASATYRSGTPRNQSRGTAGRVARWHAHLRGLATAINEISGLTSPNNIYGYCHNSGQGQQEKAIGEIQEHEVTYTKAKAVNSGSAEGPIDA